MTFPRKHLPGGRLAGGPFPLLVAAVGSGVVTPLPGRFWPDTLRAEWEAAAAAADADPAVPDLRDELTSAQLDELNERLGPPPRGGLWRSPPPAWLLAKPLSPLWEHVRAARRARRDGVLRYGLAFWADERLTEPGRRPGVAWVLWSPAPPEFVTAAAFDAAGAAVMAVMEADRTPKKFRRLVQALRDRR